MIRGRTIVLGAGLAVMVGALSAGQAVLQARAVAVRVDAPVFQVDPFWPNPLPNEWVMGSTIGVSVDDQDVVWVVHRPSSLAANEIAASLTPPVGECCAPAPPVLAFDPDGNLVEAWGGAGAGYDWPGSEHGIFVDHMGYVWLGGGDHIVKFSKDGGFVAQYGDPRSRLTGPPDAAGEPTRVANSHDQNGFGRIAKIFVDRETNEAYVADGYLNHRVAVLDASTGQMKRYWGAYGNPPDDGYEFPAQGRDDQTRPQQFRNPVHCADVSSDGLVYVCDRQGDRIQVFNRDGTFVTEGFYAPRTLGSGSAWDLAFSNDPEQRYLYLVDGTSQRVRVVLRETLAEITNFGGGGHQAGQFYGVHSIATDSQGNIYTTETYEGKRVQKFAYVGMGSVEPVQGVVWPSP